MMKRTYIHNARIVNEGQTFNGAIVIENEVIAEVLKAGEEPSAPCNETIDAQGMYLIPGVIDDHVHFRDPGLTHKADMSSESKAAAAMLSVCISALWVSPGSRKCTWSSMTPGMRYMAWASMGSSRGAAGVSPAFSTWGIT